MLVRAEGLKLLLSILTPLLALAMPCAARAQTSEEVTEQDLRLARIADVMLVANARLCRNTMPVIGMVLHSADQYGQGAQALFANGPLAISTIVPDTPATLAGLQENAAILAINGTLVSELRPEGDQHLRETAFFLLADIPEGERVNLKIKDDSRMETVGLSAPRGCRALVEILLGDGPNARSDGRIIQLQFDFARTLSDDQMAVVLAHELAHVVLEHRRRKEEADIDNASIMRHVGRNQQVNRQAEVEADRLSVHLLANAGYSPDVITRFWQSPEGIEAGGGIMPSFIYPSQDARAALVEQEVSMYLPLRQGPSWPGHLIELRDRSFARD